MSNEQTVEKVASEIAPLILGHLGRYRSRETVPPWEALPAPCRDDILEIARAALSVLPSEPCVHCGATADNPVPVYLRDRGGASVLPDAAAIREAAAKVARTFITSDASVVGCTALAVARLTINPGIVDNLPREEGAPYDDAYADKLARDADMIARCVLEGLGIDHDARGALRGVGGPLPEPSPSVLAESKTGEFVVEDEAFMDVKVT